MTLDVLLYHEVDGGELRVARGDIVLTSGFETASYLSLFGGNEEDPGEGDTTKSWWGNLDGTPEEQQYRSRTQYILRGLPATSANLRRLQLAAEQDLKWMFTEGIVSYISAKASIPALGRLKLEIQIEAQGRQYNFTFVTGWEGPQ